jgi:hypothetical protein
MIMGDSMTIDKSAIVLQHPFSTRLWKDRTFELMAKAEASTDAEYWDKFMSQSLP